MSKDTGERNWDSRKYGVQKMVQEVKPDVMGMQEATTAQRNDLKTLLPGYDLFEVPGTGTSKGGNAILMYNTAVLEAVQCKSYYLSSTPDKPSVNGWNEETQYRTTIWAEFKHKASGREKAVKTDSSPSYTGYGEGSGSVIDHIFYRNAVVSEVRTVNGHNYGVPYISDHYPIICYATIL